MLTLTIALVLVALLFDLLNGMNDSVNSIATVISTRVLSPKMAVLWAAFFNFVAAFGFGSLWQKEAGEMASFFRQFGDRLPREISLQYEKLKNQLHSSNVHTS